MLAVLAVLATFIRIIMIAITIRVIMLVMIAKQRSDREFKGSPPPTVQASSKELGPRLRCGLLCNHVSKK